MPYDKKGCGKIGWSWIPAYAGMTRIIFPHPFPYPRTGLRLLYRLGVPVKQRYEGLVNSYELDVGDQWKEE